MSASIYLIPVVTCLIGWFTNVIAVKMLFYPKKPLRLGFFTLQGLVPKRHFAMASSLSTVFDEELLSGHDLAKRFQEIDFQDDVKDLIDCRLDAYVLRLKQDIPMAGMFLNEQLSAELKTRASTELVGALPDIQGVIADRMKGDYDIRGMIEKKIQEFSLDQLESMVMKVATKELRSIEVLGGVLGFLIGLVQLLFLI